MMRKWMMGIAFAAVMAGPAVADVPALVAALSGEDAAARHAAYESAGQYGPEAIAAVAPLLDSDNRSTVRAAREALERIAGPATKDEETRKAASMALCEAAGALKTRAGRDWVLWLLSYTGGPEAVAPLMALVDNAEIRDGALLALQGIGGDDVSKALAAKLEGASSDLKVAIAGVLGATGGAAAEYALLLEYQAGNPAALDALGRIGGPATIHLLTAKLAEGCDPDLLNAYLRIAEREGHPECYKKLLDISDEPIVVCAALAGLGRTGGAGEMGDILPYLDAEAVDVFGAARGALIALKPTAVDAKLRSALKGSSPGARVALLDVMARRDPDSAVPVLEGAVHDGDPEVRVTAFGLLAESPRKKHESLFLKEARAGTGLTHPVALEGYLRLADQMLYEKEDDRALAMYHEAIAIAARDDEKRHALEGMARLASPASLPLAQGLLDSPGTRAEAAACLFAIAEVIKTADAEKAKTLFMAVLKNSPSDDLATSAAMHLGSMGVETNFAGEQGFITYWRLIGPFPKTSFDASFPPETDFNLEAEYDGAGGKKVRWGGLPVRHVRGITKLHEILDPNENVIAYARAEVVVKDAVDVLVKMGSDDGIVCWVNGQQIHANDASRRVVVDQDVARARLNAGVNVILVKIVQGGSDWAFCVRLTDLEGRPLTFEN
jgi:HEAT repeat protein